MSDSEFSMGMVVGSVITAALIIIVLVSDGAHSNQEVIDQGCASYDSQTGDFTWKEK